LVNIEILGWLEKSDKTLKNCLLVDDPFGTRAAMGVDNIPKIKNKIKRRELFRDAKIQKAKKKLTERKERTRAEKLDPKLKEVTDLNFSNC